MLNYQNASAFGTHRSSSVVNEVSLNEEECVPAFKTFVFDVHILDFFIEFLYLTVIYVCEPVQEFLQSLLSY